MGEDDGTVDFFQPYVRAMMPIEGLRVSRSLRRTLRSERFKITFDTAYEEVMRACRRPRENWINEPIIRTYMEIFRQGWGHSAECWYEGRLVGGTYGLAVGLCFSAESMFHRETDAGKVALWAMVERCREMGFLLFDAQVMNPHLESLGAYPMAQAEFLRFLHESEGESTPWSQRAG